MMPIVPELQSRPLLIPCSGGALAADLALPAAARALVLFAHGSGSDRRSPRNGAVATHLQRLGLATLLIDLRPGAQTLLAAVDWVALQPELAPLPLGLFGASSGAAAVLEVAARRPEQVRALVSRGGRPDLARAVLGLVRCPTLLIVGGEDRGVVELNAWAAERLRCPHALVVVPGAGHLFAEAGALEAVAAASGTWFDRQLCRR